MVVHIVEYRSAAEALGGFAAAIVVVAVSLAIVLAALHYRVMHETLEGFVSAAIRLVATGLSFALVVAIAPAASGDTETDVPEGLPDLVSEPPRPWRTLLIDQPDGSVRQVFAFDGFLHNVGPGVLELAGNPQEESGIKQRWLEDGEWQSTGSPPVRYETTDDHNHFHLMAAAEYALWNEALTEKVSDASKVGFCLVDTERITEGYESLYEINANQYCQQNNPDAGFLEMGITPGWVDIYDGNTTLQWVDTSDIAPGRYFIGAVTDPDDQIVEFDEANNAEVFSESSFELSGWRARPLEMQSAAEPIQLKADPFGTVADVQWEIVEGPANGTLSVPTGFVFAGGTVRYEPNSEFEGTDSFRYVARDRNSGFPLDPEPVTVQIEVGAASDGSPASSEANDDVSIVDDGADATGLFGYRAVSIAFSHTAGETSPEIADQLRWYANGLPTGLVIDAETGVVTGVPAVVDSSGSAEIVVALGAQLLDTQPLEWSVLSLEDSARSAIDDVIPLSSPLGKRFNLTVGITTPDAVYEAEGLPPGVRMVENVPLVTGDPEAAGVYEIKLFERVDGEITDESTFVWTIRHGATPAFPL